MKIHSVNMLIAAAVCALLTYGLMSIDANSIKGTLGIGAFISLASTLALAVGVSFDRARTGTNVRVVAVLFFVGALCLNTIFAFAGFSQTSYIITCGVFFLVYVLIATALFEAKT